MPSLSPISSRGRAAELVAEEWSRNGLPFTIAHGLEPYPKDIGRDLDILMDQRLAERALSMASSTLVELGWDVARPPDIWGKRLVALLPGDELPQYLELHTFGVLVWAVVTLGDHTEPASHRIGPFPVNPWVTFAKAVLMPLLGGTFSKLGEDSLAALQEAGVKGPEIRARCLHLLGGRVGSDLYTAYQARASDRLVDLAILARRACLARAVLHPAALVGGTGRFTTRRLRRFWTLSGVQVDLAIPHGIDAGEMSDSLIGFLDRVFLPIEIGPPAALRDRVRQQYRILCRQGVVVQLVPSQDESVQIRARLPRGGWAESSFPVEDPSVTARRTALWVLDQWLEALRWHG